MKQFALLLLLVLSVQSTLAYSLAEFKQNLTDTSPEARAYDLALHAKLAGADKTWEKCADIVILGKTCIQAYIVPQNLSLGVRLLVRDKVILNQGLSYNNACVNENTLIKLLELIPELLPFKPLIDSILKAKGYIPAKVFSVCVNINNLDVNTTDISGCAALSATLICWENNCVAKKEVPFGCFDIPL
eukprot:Colp12_sorted_trinity150504_noHs@3177